jgi:hypothetical protein
MDNSSDGDRSIAAHFSSDKVGDFTKVFIRETNYFPEGEQQPLRPQAPTPAPKQGSRLANFQ